MGIGSRSDPNLLVWLFWLSTAARFFIGVVPALGSGFPFPSTGASDSPDGKWKLICKSPANDAADQRHLLLLLNRVEGRGVELRRIDRNCDTLWSPDSTRIALTDAWASDRSDIFIYFVAHRGPAKSVRALFPKNVIPAEELQGHCYFEACGWLDSHRLRFKVSGHTDEFPVHGFDHEYILEVTSWRFKATKKKPSQTLRGRVDSRRYKSDVIGGCVPALIFAVNRHEHAH